MDQFEPGNHMNDLTDEEVAERALKDTCRVVNVTWVLS